MKNFKLVKEQFIEELNTLAKLYIHTPTDAEFLSLTNDDENKCFGVAFKTPPNDSTGVAHILEHTVLCGSKKYPVKDPFVQLLKGSLQTFLNAFTYPDKTCYPVASQNLKDFYNLTDVYLDSVFFPLITEDFFKQEGWHYHLQNISEPLEYKGVVYNEMKGVYSSADSVLMETSQQSLFPDTTYGLDSGGKPEKIPELTYQKFKKFHETYYHPSNARFVFYGDDPESTRFDILEEYLKLFSKIKPTSDIKIQPAFISPVRISKPFSVSDSEKNPKPMFTMNWALPSSTNIDYIFLFSIIDYILLGSPASPLRKALIESGLGEDITGGGLETHLQQMFFSVGLKGISQSDLEKAETLILKTLEDLVNNTIDKNDIEAAINTFEFDLRENNTGGFPRGLSLWLKALNGWNYGADPISLIAFEEPLNKLKKDIKTPLFIEKNIKKFFIENNHRSIVNLYPDRHIAEKIENAEKNKLELIKSNLSENELKNIQRETLELLKLQSTPDTAEAIATLPLLKKSDLNPKIQTIHSNHNIKNNIKIIEHSLFTNGVFYIDLAINLESLEAEEIPFVALLSNLYLEMGTENESYSILSQRIAQKTGGIYGSPFISPHTRPNESVKQFFLRGKCMINQTDQLISIYSDILLKPNFNDKERFKQIVLEHKSEMESSIIPRGHSAIMTRLKARDHIAHDINEKIGGIDGLFFVRDLLDNIENDWSKILIKIEGIHDKLINQNNISINLTSDEKSLDKIRESIHKFATFLPNKEIKTVNSSLSQYQKSEALLVPSRINFVGASANLFESGYKMHGSSLVISRYLQTSWLWEKIRVQGGAYGGMCSFDYRSGSFAFVSYRDPNLLETIDIYKKTGAYLKNLVLSNSELTRALIGAIGQLDSYQLPDAKSLSNYKRIFLNFTDHDRQKLRDEVLSTTEKDFYSFGEYLEYAFKNPDVVVLCDKEAAMDAGFKTMNRIL